VSLQNWLRNGWLTEHETSPQEIADLFAVVDRDLADAQVAGLSPDTRLRLAYNAALQAATAALAASGYRVARRERHHYLTIESLADTIGADSDLITRFDKFRKKRNIGDYERVGMVSDQEADEMFDLACALRRSVEKWIAVNHPEVLER